MRVTRSRTSSTSVKCSPKSGPIISTPPSAARKTRTTRNSLRASGATELFPSKERSESPAVDDENLDTENAEEIGKGQIGRPNMSSSSKAQTSKIVEAQIPQSYSKYPPKRSFTHISGTDSTASGIGSSASSKNDKGKLGDVAENPKSESAGNTGAHNDESKSKSPDAAVEGDRLADKEKLQISNEHVVRNLYRTMWTNFRDAENAGLNFLCNEVHHPVVPCFRELMNLNDLSSIFRQNSKKALLSFEFGVLALTMLDSIAMTLFNPLYQESYDCIWNKNVAKKVEKILNKLEPLLTSWGTSEKSSEQKQYATMVKYLQRLVPHYQSVQFSESFESKISKITDSVTKFVTTREETRLKKQSFFNSKETKDTTTLKSVSTCAEVVEVEPISPIQPVTPSSSPMSKILLLAESKSRDTTSTPDIENDCNLSACSESPSPQKKPKILFPSPMTNASEAECMGVNLLNKFTDKADDGEPTTKKPRLESVTDSPNNSPKPKVNAFALMMNETRRRQLAELGKASPPSPRTSKVKPKVKTITIV